MDKPVTSSAGPRPAPETSPAADHEMILASLLEAVIAFGLDGRAVFVNQAAEAVLGRSRSALYGNTADEIFGDAAWIREQISAVSEAGESGLRSEGSLTDASGTREVVAEVTRLRDGSGHVAGTVVAIHDIGRTYVLRQQEEARSRTEGLYRLVAQLGHEINNPLSGIRGAAQRIGRRLEKAAGAGSAAGIDAAIPEYAEMIVRQADRLAGLVSGLLALETPRTERRAVNVHKVLHDVILLCQPDAASKNVRLVQHFDPSLPEIFGDPEQLQQVFLNITRNAVAFCRPGGEVTLGTRMLHGFHVETDDGRVQYISVDTDDEGPGMDDETLEHLFSPLFSRAEGGHGLGMAIAHSIVQRHEGLIEAMNRCGTDTRSSPRSKNDLNKVECEGARVRVILPVATDSGKAQS